MAPESKNMIAACQKEKLEKFIQLFSSPASNCKILIRTVWGVIYKICIYLKKGVIAMKRKKGISDWGGVGEWCKSWQ